MSALDALGDGHLALARQQGHRAHLAQVHAHRVVRLLQCARRQVEIVFLGGDFFFGFGIGDLGGFRGSARGPGAGDILVDVDVVALEGGEQVVDLP